jgi:hypothetical protein
MSPVLDTEPTRTCENPIDSNGTQDIRKSKYFIPELTGIFEDFGRQFLTAILGQYLSLQDLLEYVPKEGESFLGFQLRRDILDRDENGEYQENLTIQIDEFRSH